MTLFDGEFTRAEVDAKRLPTAVNLGLTGACGVLYVLEFSNGLIKVGRSSTPSKRIRQHMAAVRGHANAELVRGWISEAHDNVLATELDLIRFAQDDSESFRGREHCWGASFPSLIKHADGLSKLSPLFGPQREPGPSNGKLLAMAMSAVAEADERLTDYIEDHNLYGLPTAFEGEQWHELALSLQGIADTEPGFEFIELAETSWLDMLEQIVDSRVRAYKARLDVKLLEIRRRIYEEKRFDLLNGQLPSEHIPGYQVGPVRLAIESAEAAR